MKDTRNYAPEYKILATRFINRLVCYQQVATYSTGYLNNTVDFAPIPPMNEIQELLNSGLSNRRLLGKRKLKSTMQEIHTKHIIGI